MAGAPRARLFATRGLRNRKALDSAVVLKKISQIEAKEKKLRPFKNWHSKPPVRMARTWTSPQPKSLDFGHLSKLISKGEPDFRNISQLTVRADLDADWRI